MNIRENVKDYYGKVLQKSADLKTDACCTIEDLPGYLKPILANIHPEVAARYYGCGLIAPLGLSGARVLDLGSGSGQDAYALAQLVGAEGKIIGVDMTAEQLGIARRYQDWHARKFGFANVEFVEGDIERLGDLDLEPASFDVIISNCVINLVSDKEAVFRAIHGLLKPGGEFYFADVYADRRIRDEFRNDPIAQGECLGGALYWFDFLTMAKQAGFSDPRLDANRPISINNPALREKLAPARFCSATYRLFNIDTLEASREDYGQKVVYQGGVAHSENSFTLDHRHLFEMGRETPVCGNTFRILREARFAGFFQFIDKADTHSGLFPDGGTISPFRKDEPDTLKSDVCC